MVVVCTVVGREATLPRHALHDEEMTGTQMPSPKEKGRRAFGPPSAGPSPSAAGRAAKAHVLERGAAAQGVEDVVEVAEGPQRPPAHAAGHLRAHPHQQGRRRLRAAAVDGPGPGGTAAEPAAGGRRRPSHLRRVKGLREDALADVTARKASLSTATTAVLTAPPARASAWRSPLAPACRRGRSLPGLRSDCFWDAPTGAGAGPPLPGGLALGLAFGASFRAPLGPALAALAAALTAPLTLLAALAVGDVALRAAEPRLSRAPRALRAASPRVKWRQGPRRPASKDSTARGSSRPQPPAQPSARTCGPSWRSRSPRWPARPRCSACRWRSSRSPAAREAGHGAQGCD